MSHPRPKESCPHREAILDAAWDLLLKHGYKGMTIDELANAVNVAKGTVYLYFESKEDVALSVIERWHQQTQVTLRSIIRGKGTCAERLHQLIVERVLSKFLRVQQLTHGLDELMVPLRPRLLQRRHRYHESESLIFAELLIEGRTRGEFEFDDPFAVGFAIVQATNSLLPYSLSPCEIGAIDVVRERTTVLADLLVRAVLRHTLPDDEVGPVPSDRF